MSTNVKQMTQIMQKYPATESFITLYIVGLSLAGNAFNIYRVSTKTVKTLSSSWFLPFLAADWSKLIDAQMENEMELYSFSIVASSIQSEKNICPNTSVRITNWVKF